MEDPSSQTLLLQALLLLVLTLLNAFFSAAEMAMVSLNRARVEQKAEEGDARGQLGQYTRSGNCFLDGKFRDCKSQCKLFICCYFDLYFDCFW